MRIRIGTTPQRLAFVVGVVAMAVCGGSADETALSTSMTIRPGPHPGPHFEYEGPEGPEHWGDLDPSYAACSTGKSQSPIDIVDPVLGGKAPPIVAYTPGVADVVNTGHTIQANAPPGMSIELDGTRYGLLQVHFHSPGEHALGGASGPVELHFVHRSAAGGLAVLAFIAQAGAANPAWQPFVDAVGTREGDHAAVPLDWARLVPASITTMRYAGSLTTPPCTEGVLWLVVKEPLSLSEAQIRALSGAYSGTSRPLQPAAGRTVSVDSPRP